MAYRLKSGEPVPQGVKRIAAEEARRAADLLSRATAATRDEAIHEARKSVKKTRALLRLMRPEIDGVYRRENTRLRNIGRRLSAYRDRAVIIETFDDLKRKYQGELKGVTLASIRRGLVRNKREQQRGANLRTALQRIAAALRSAAGRAARWPLEADGFEALEPGLTATYRRARRAMAVVRAHARPEHCHEWRKRAKDHWYDIRLLAGVWTEETKACEKSLKDLETALGDHHNLEVLKGTLAAHPAAYGPREDIDLCLSLIERYQKDLLESALTLGARVYQERPAQFRTRLLLQLVRQFGGYETPK
jgi:CHAD domain-containing protein